MSSKANDIPIAHRRHSQAAKGIKFLLFFLLVITAPLTLASMGDDARSIIVGLTAFAISVAILYVLRWHGQ